MSNSGFEIVALALALSSSSARATTFQSQLYACEIKRVIRAVPDGTKPTWKYVSEERGTRKTIYITNLQSTWDELYKRIHGIGKWKTLGLMRFLGPEGGLRPLEREAEMECLRWKLRGDAQPPGERMGYEVSVSWSPESPLFAEVRVRQKQGDGWSPPGRRVPVSLNLRRNPSRTSLHSAYTAHVIDRASPAGPMSQLWFKDTHEFQPLRTDLQTGVCRINLLRSFDVESNTSYALSYDRLTDLFQLVNSGRAADH